MADILPSDENASDLVITDDEDASNFVITDNEDLSDLGITDDEDASDLVISDGDEPDPISENAHISDSIVLELCTMFKIDLAIIEGICVIDNDESWDRGVDNVLHGMLLMPPQNVVKEEQPLLNYMHTCPRWRERGFAARAWRLQMQAITLLAFITLSTRGLVDLSATRGAIDFEDLEWHTWHIQLALSNFEFARKFENTPDIALCHTYKAPLTWLACMIARGTTVSRIEIIIDELKYIGIFGSFDDADFRKRWPIGTRLRRKPLAMNPIGKRDWWPQQVDFYLPTRTVDTSTILGTAEFHLLVGRMERWTVHRAILNFLSERHRSWELFKAYFMVDWRGEQREEGVVMPTP